MLSCIEIPYSLTIYVMRRISQNINNPTTAALRRDAAIPVDADLTQLAFNNVAQANIIIIVKTGKIIMANKASCKLFGYSKKELLTKSRVDIFAIKESSFKKMIKQRTAEGQSKAKVLAIKKNGKPFFCEITSAVFTGEDGIVKSITTVTDMTQRLLDQKIIDAEKDKLVAANIDFVKLEQKKIDVKKDKIVADNIFLVKSKQKTIDRNKKMAVANDIILAKAKQKKIDIKKDKLVADHIVAALKKSDARMAEHNEWIKYIAKSSYDVMWDWDIATGQVYVGDSIEEVFGYKVRNNSIAFTDLCRCLVSKEQGKVKSKLMKTIISGSKSWNDSFMFKRRDGTLASANCRACIVGDDEGKAIRLIGAIQDVSRLEDLEKKFRQQITIHEEDSEKFLLAAKLSFDVIWDWDLTTNVVFIGEGFEELFGYHIKNKKGEMMHNWVNHLHPDDREAVVKELQNAIKSSATNWEHAYNVSRADGSIAKVYIRASIIRHKDGKAFRMIGAMHDLSRQNDLEEKLDHEIKLKGKQITDAAEDANEMERSNIRKELHDNINQLLGASWMYLEMAKKGGPGNAMYLSRSSEYTLSAIEEIRKLTKGLSTNIINDLGLCIAIENLASDLQEVNMVKISCALREFKEETVTNKFKLNIFRIIQEQVNNILKHAQATKVSISLLQNGNRVQLDITDNGIGFDTKKKQTGIGVDNIKSRAISYHGKADFISKPGSGCKLTVTFPVTA